MRSQIAYSFLTLHKAGSSFVAGILQSLFLENGWEVHDLATEAFNFGVSEFEYIEDRLPMIASKRGLLGPFRGEAVAVVGNLAGLTPIIHVRDPRDCLVSYYYSISFSHVLPGPGPERDRFVKMREYHRERTVDDFCLDVLVNGDRSLNLLRAVAETNPEVIISRYEHMVTDFSGWMSSLSRNLPFSVSDIRVSELGVNMHVPEREDIYSHKRQVIPGDFRRKLSIDTQRRLTEFFAEDLEYFGYRTDI